MTVRRVGLQVIRWLAFSSTALITLILLLNMKDIVGYSPKPGDVGVVVLLMVIPALIATLLNAFNWLWPNLVLGPWFIIVSAIIRADNQHDLWSLLLVVCSLIMFLAPVVAIAARRRSRQDRVSEGEQRPTGE